MTEARPGGWLRARFGTLRMRLVLAMAGVLLVALLGEAGLGDLAGRGAVLIGAGLPEPYQDGLVLGLFGLVSLPLIWLVSSWSLRPLRRASAEAGRAGPGAPELRIGSADLPAEIAPLVEAVNDALARMAQAMAAERRFTENAAHELRTPLAVLGLRLQRARAAEAAGSTPDWPAIEADMARMQHLVGQLLDLAAKTHARMTVPFNLCRAAREAAGLTLPLIESRGRELDVALPDAIWMLGAAEHVRDAIRNLLENAALHGAGPIRLACWREGGQAVVEVADAGPGIAPALRPRVFSRFAKGAETEGSGLGLAIVREVAEAHGGTVGVVDAPGCVIRLRLPAAGDAGPGIAASRHDG